MQPCSRRQLLTAASVGVVGPLIIDSSAGAAGRAVIAVSQVPIGGGVVVSRRGVVVTRQAKRRFRVFDAACTHQGCPVSDVSGGRITCPCHGSQFSATTGAVLAGPAGSPLPPKRFTVKRGKIYLA
ncbi:Rieske (2Fe-2S) protein [Nocardioides sp. R-C-SC26]|uniref:Rieske (2Fe-2S) protein n=1 Tax=Nocardioides sp. R-C-SC26 TaxID=2870414 RepID=UPI001E51DAB2|nr:Rieske (2Fe-2S) protein [Nocardioides sp. R-C-SC26]